MRLFVALEIPAAVREELDRRAEAFRRSAPPARWVRPDGIHLTLAFYGEVAEDKVSLATDLLRQACVGRAPAILAVRGAGWFPPGGSARVVWVGVESSRDLAPLAVDAAAIGLRAGAAAAPDERPFHAHVTLARCQPPWRREAAERFVERFAVPVGEPFDAAAVTLFRSRLERGGARYEAIERFPLAGAA